MGTDMRAKKLVILLAVLLVVGLGLFGWFRPREVVLPENCRFCRRSASGGISNSQKAISRPA